MGVKGLWSFLEPAAYPMAMTELQALKVGIDGPIWTLQARSCCQNVATFFHRRIEHLRRNGVEKVVVVFDCLFVPDFKISTVEERLFNSKRYRRPRDKRDSTGLDPLQKREALPSPKVSLSSFLESLGVECRRSEGESESLLAQMNISGEIDAVISEDVDAFLFGSRRVIRGFSCDSKKLPRSFDIEGISALRLDREKLIGVALLCGCDFDQRGVPGIGIKRAVKFMKDSPGDGKAILDRMRRWIGHVASALKRDSEPSALKRDSEPSAL